MTPPPSAGTPLSWRLALLAAVAGLTTTAYANPSAVGPRGQAGCGVVALIALVAAFSADLRAVRGRTLAAGLALQFGLAAAVIHVPPVRAVFAAAGDGARRLLGFAADGGRFVFGNLADPAAQQKVYADGYLFPFAFVALPPIIFASGLFAVLYQLRVLPLAVRAVGWVMGRLMGTSGAESLCVAANVALGQCEAPLLVRPYLAGMTTSELLAVMASGMAHVSGGMMALYIGYASGYFGDPGEAAAAILATCVMACPASLYLSKLLVPETGRPATLGAAAAVAGPGYVNPLDAFAAGVADGLKLALTVAAMLIGFLAAIALVNGLLGGVKPAAVAAGVPADAVGWWPDRLTLQHLLGWAFRPAAFLMGVPADECGRVGSLLGVKLVANEHVAFLALTTAPGFAGLSPRARTLAVYALTGFANFGSVGVQLGGLGALADGRRADLARLGGKALFVGFVATLVNAAVAGLVM